MYHRIAVLLAMLFWIATALLAQDATELASRANPVTPDAWLSRQGGHACAMLHHCSRHPHPIEVG